MGTNDTIKSDNTYTLRQLLSDLTLVIPDMQRDYCWGKEGGSGLNTKSKVTLFTSGLVYLYRHGKDTPLGLLYGYEEPAGSKRMLIIDGQQRLTTLYLLIGMLYRRTPTDALRQLLISDYELIDNHEPRLLYQARNEALYFMSDLVMNFFLDRNGRLSQLEKSPWYYPVYDSDPTVQSFIKAIRLIDDVLEQASQLPQWDFGAFAEFVTDRLVFIYHDLGLRQQGESAFITINTTGEPLTYPQNVKSLLVAASGEPQEIISKWEEMEQWAWLHRDKSEPGRDTTSDPALERFIRLWVARNGGDEEAAMHPDNFERMYAFFRAYRRLTDCIPDALHVASDTAYGQFLLLPSVAYIRKWKYADRHDAQSLRAINDLWSWLTNITRYTRVSASGADTESALKIVSQMPTPDIVSMLSIKGASERLLNSDESAKLTLIAGSAGQRGKAHRLIAKATAHPMLNGKMQRLIAWCTDRDGATDLNRLEAYIDAIYKIWGTDIEANTDLDPLRRALLTLRHPDYPLARRGNTCLSLCWHDYDWQRLMANSPGLIRLLIDRVSQSQIPVQDTLLRMCARFKDRSYPYYFLIDNPDTIMRCEHRMLLHPCLPFIGFYLHDDSDATWATDMRWHVEQNALKIDKRAWTTLRAYGARCLYTDHRTYNLSIDLYYTPDEAMPYRLELFVRDDSDKPQYEALDITYTLGQYGHDVKYDKKRRRHYITLPDARTAASLLQRLTSTL